MSGWSAVVQRGALEKQPQATENPALAAVSESARQLALDRFGLLRLCLEDGVPLAEVARQHGLQLRRLQRWMRAYPRDGLAGLARKSCSDRGHPTLYGPLQQLIEGLALRRPRLSCAVVHREVVAVATDRGMRAPSYDTVYSVIRRLDPALVTLAIAAPKCTPIATICSTDARHPGATPCGKPITRRWTCACSTTAANRHDRG